MKSKIRVAVYCPVCRKDGYLGLRDQDLHFQGVCRDCGFTHYFFPSSDKPYESKLVKKIKACTCGGCEKRDGKGEKEIIKPVTEEPTDYE